MRTVAVAVSAGVFAVSLAVPSLLLAQEPEAAPPPAAPPATEPPPEEVPPPPAAEAPPNPEEPPAAEPVDATQAPDATTTPAPAAKASTSVSMLDFSYSPSSVTINVGDTITWINDGEEDHTSTGSGFDTGIVAPGDSGSATFSSAGSFPYVCSLHPNMRGTVTVTDPSSGTDDTGTTDGTDPATGAPLDSEAAAVAAPGAAGSADALPASGETEAPLLVLGAGLLGCGLLATVLARWRARESTLWPSA